MDDRSQDTHTLNCPICSAPVSVMAESDEDAIGKLMDARKQHFKDASHDPSLAMSDEVIEKTTRELVRKV